MFNGLRVFAVLIFGLSTFTLPTSQPAFADEDAAAPAEKAEAPAAEEAEKDKKQKKKHSKKRDCVPSGTRIPRC